MEIAEIRGEKNGGGWGSVPDRLGQTNYAEMCILVTKYTSKLKTNYVHDMYLIMYFTEPPVPLPPNPSCATEREGQRDSCQGCRGYVDSHGYGYGDCDESPWASSKILVS